MRLSLRKKIWLYSLGPLLLIAGAMLFVVQWQVSQRVRENVALDLETAAGNLRSQLATRERDLATMGFVISRDPKFFAMLTVPPVERGPEFAATIHEVALDFHRAVGRDLLDVFDERGRVLARVTDADAAGDAAGELPGVRGALSGRPVSGIVVENGAPYQVAVVPVVVSGEIVGVLRIGQAIDAALAEGLRELTRSEVSFVANGTVSATTLDAEAADDLAAALGRFERDRAAARRVVPLAVGGEVHLTRAESVGGLLAPGGVTFVLQRSLREELAFLMAIEKMLLVIGLFGAVAAAAAGFLAARGITAPLMKVVKAGEALERGNYDYPLAVSTGDEVEALARQFGAMRSSIRTSITRLEDLDRMKSNFISIASHELRTPVTALKGFLYILRDGSMEKLGPHERELVEGMESTMEDLTRVVQEITDMSLLDRKDLRLRLAPARIEEVARTVVEINAAFFRRRRLAVRVDVGDDLRPVLIDRERMEQAVQNLISNAIRFTPDGGKVTVGVRRLPGEVQLCVRDTGIGIPESELARIFDRVYEIGNVVHHSSGTIEFGSSGIGLGLPIAKGIVEAHGGCISVESAVGQGSVFTIHLPVHAADAEAGPSGIAAEPHDAAAARLAAPAGAALALALVLVAGAASAEIGWRGSASFTARDEADALDLNRLNYRDSSFDPVRARLFVDGVASENVSVFGQFLIDDVSSMSYRIYGLYAVVSDFAPTNLTVEVGRLPTIFGTFGPRAYETKNPLVGAPLVYQYHTALRYDQLPLSADALVRQSGKGQYGVAFRDESGEYTGASTVYLGVPILYDACWDVGVAALGTWRRIEYAVGVTQGSAGVPAFGRDTNDGKQFVGRLGVVPLGGLRVSASASTAPYLARTVETYLPAGADVEDFAQTVFGASVDASWSRFVFAAELVESTFESPWIDDDLEATAWYAEGKVTVAPGAYVAARFDRIAFGEIDVAVAPGGGGRRVAWDRDVQRAEATVGYWLARGWLMRADVQLWDDDGGSWETSHSLGALQSVFSF